MGIIEVRNLLLSKKLKLSTTKLLIIDDNQIRYNEIINIFKSKNHLVQAILLDDLKSFEKQLNTDWDLIIFAQAYDFRIEQAITVIQASAHIDIPILLLEPEDYQVEQYQSYMHKGIYDIVSIKNNDLFYIHAIRALSFSRELQAKTHLLDDLENVKSHALSLVDEQNKAVAEIQEGIHTSANAEYLKLFGIQHEQDIIGLPLLDILQPNNLNGFKNHFKKVSQGQFEFARLEVKTTHPSASSQNPLKIEFLSSEKDDALQIVIETAQTTSVVPSLDTPKISSPFQQIHATLLDQPANANALVLFTLANCPNEILNSDWKTIKGYFDQIPTYLKNQTHLKVYRIDYAFYAILMQAESLAVLQSRINGLELLQKPQLLELSNQSYPLQLRIGHHVIEANEFNEHNFEKLLETTYNTRLTKQNTELDQQLSATLAETKLELAPVEFDFAPAEQTPSVAAPIKEAPSFNIQAKSSNIESPTLNIETQPLIQESTLLQLISEKLEKGEIQLKFQQLYDKQDLNLNTYEVTSGFIIDNQFKLIQNLTELDDDIELSIKLDRWVLVEACKQLHNFINQYPEAKLIVNLNRHVLFKDTQFPELISKLITIVGSRLEHPLVLQFDEDAIAKNVIEAQKHIDVLKANGAEISLRNFGSTPSSEAIIQKTNINHVTLQEKYTEMLNHDKTLAELQQMIEQYNAIRPVEILIKNLNDMNTFANVWNVEVRFLQGDYFQRKQDHLTDVQDQ